MSTMEQSELEALDAALTAALQRREGLLASLLAEGTDCYRLLHGTNEGVPGLSVDRYGPQLLIQSFHRPLAPGGQDLIAERVRSHFDPLEVVYHDRSAPNSRYARQHTAEAPVSHVGHELGLSYKVQAEHAGQDPLLFLDLRVGRRHLLAHSAGKRVLNLFAYTCGLGLCAAKGGASEVWNVDFAAGSLAVGRENAALNGLGPEAMRFVQSDFFTAARQLAGLPVTWRRQQKPRPYLRLEPQKFDLVCLEPPAWAKSPFGTVDLVRDYQSLLKPVLLLTAEGGSVLCTNNVASVDRDGWLEMMHRCAAKAGRPIQSCQVLEPEADFPSPDGRPPLKIAVLGL